LSYLRLKVLILLIAVSAMLTSMPAFAVSGIYYVSDSAPIEDGNIVKAQREALNITKGKAVQKALMEMFPEKTYEVFNSFLNEKIVPQADLFITNYKIDNQDISDLAYAINLTVRVDVELLRKHLSKLGLIKVPGSPPLASVFVTLDIPVDRELAEVLAKQASDTISSNLIDAGVTFIPPPVESVKEAPDGGIKGEVKEVKPEFRIIRPPQTQGSLIIAGIDAMTDLAIGVNFQKNGEIEGNSDSQRIPVKLSVEAIDTGTAESAFADSREVTVVFKSTGERVIGNELSRTIKELSALVAAELKADFVDRETIRSSYTLNLEGSVTSFVIRELTYRLKTRLGEEASILPAAYTKEQARLNLWTAMAAPKVIDILKEVELTGFSLDVEQNDGVFTILLRDDPAAVKGVIEYGLEVPFYKRIPVPGLENPEDLKKIELVQWAEQEENGTIYTANIAPVGMGIIGKINYSRDHDFYHFLLPEKTIELAVRVELTGPDELQSRVRIFSSAGKLISDTRARRRGKNLYQTVRIDPDTRAVILAMEDYLGRHKSLFSYVLNVDARVK